MKNMSELLPNSQEIITKELLDKWGIGLGKK